MGSVAVPENVTAWPGLMTTLLAGATIVPFGAAGALVVPVEVPLPEPPQAVKGSSSSKAAPG